MDFSSIYPKNYHKEINIYLCYKDKNLQIKDNKNKIVKKCRYACFLIGIDEYGDSLIERFIKEDKDYLFEGGAEYSDLCFTFKNYTSKDTINIEEDAYINNSIIFFIGIKNNNIVKKFDNKYGLNIIKIFKDRDVENGKSVFYAENYERTKSFLRYFTIPLNGLNSMDLLFSTDLFYDNEDGSLINFNKTVEYGLITAKWKDYDGEEKVGNFLNNIPKIDAKWLLIRLLFTRLDCLKDDNSYQVGLHKMHSYMEILDNKANKNKDIRKDKDYAHSFFAMSAWKKDYHEIEIIYGKRETYE